MRFTTPILLPLILPATSARSSNSTSLHFPRHQGDPLPKRASDCPTAYPTPRSNPAGTQPPYPIQITLSSPNSDSQDQGGQDQGGQDQDQGPDSTSENQSQSQPPPPAVEIGFTLPPSQQQDTSSDPGPCTLFLDLTSPSARVSGSATVNIYALDGPAPGALVGTTRFAAGAVATVNSFACREEEMCFRLEVVQPGGSGDDEDDEGGGGGDEGGGDGEVVVEFLQGGVEGMGLGMRYGC
ncbi:hypothetical protein C8A00DRAFT_36862 [Chaetomidium leptoderma]|uniref:Ubiquitin 3 binding protein But2 C-terminal domain-containing protein n=1 Tax=Chaetomidium leptoderma TaxID=669021 RepID=A0AAN6ZSS1_9PEZI|nr:hypothetical protein C8A00DRAFT_36862 [Chaetomidium leptoderma]